MPVDMRKMTCLQTLSMFIVGANEGEDIKELERMDSLRGELEIRCLEHVKSGRDAEYANLMKKKRIKALRLVWFQDWRRLTEEETKREVIEGLQPDSNLRKLEISGYEGIGFPRWLDCSTLPNLVEISLKRCRRCELPPSLSRLPFLKTLKVVGMPCVKFLFHSEDEDMNSDDMVNRFSSLEELTLNDHSELEWCSFRGKGGGGDSEGQMFLPPRIKKLLIDECPKLRMARLSPSLETLSMTDSNEMTLGSLKDLPCLSFLSIGHLKVANFPEGSLQNLTTLRSLSIFHFNQLKILPKELGDLSNLRKLRIDYCGQLVSLPEEMRNLPSIKILVINKCKKLESLPEVGSSSLIEVKIEDCERMKNITGVLNGCQSVLQQLTICNCPNMELESVEFAHLIALQHLRLREFPMIELLAEWIGSLTQLRSLKIQRFKKLIMLPEGLRLLTNLEHLTILNCHPDLHRRCQKRKGEDWHKISHIPDIHNSDGRGAEKDSLLGKLTCFNQPSRINF